jgi:hypothetical protein
MFGDDYRNVQEDIQWENIKWGLKKKMYNYFFFYVMIYLEIFFCLRRFTMEKWGNKMRVKRKMYIYCFNLLGNFFFFCMYYLDFIIYVYLNNFISINFFFLINVHILSMKYIKLNLYSFTDYKLGYFFKCMITLWKVKFIKNK